MPVERLYGDGFTIELKQCDGYLRAVVCEGVDSLAVSIAYHRMLGAECVRRGTQRLLVLEDLSDSGEPIDTEAIAQAAREAGYEGFRMAFVELRGNHDVNEHGEISCLMQGLRVRVFINEMQARQWLLYGGIEDGEQGPGTAVA